MRLILCHIIVLFIQYASTKSNDTFECYECDGAIRNEKKAPWCNSKAGLETWANESKIECLSQECKVEENGNISKLSF